MHFSVWTKRRLLICAAVWWMASVLANAGCTLLILELHTRQRAEAATILCAEADRDAAVPAAAMGESGVFEVQAVPKGTAAPAAEASEPGAGPTPEQPDGSSAAAQGFRVEVVRNSPQPERSSKRILIYHTHTWEAFEQVKDAPYRETEKWRSKDNRANMVAVGDALTAALQAMGYEVVHDTTAFEPPNLSDSYQRSLAMLERRAADGETYDLYIDLHRDAFSSAKAIQCTVDHAGEKLARIMVLVGKGEGYEQKPDWQANLKIAQQLTEHLNAQVTDLGRDVKIKTGRFNQHIAPCCVLIECGCNYNTLQQVLCSMPYLAQAISDTIDQE